MNFNSINYIIFLPIVSALYFVCPKKQKNLYLLAVSYFFYFCNEVRFFLLLPMLSFITYLFGLSLEKNKKKSVFIFSIAANIGTLLFFKYNRFFFDAISTFTDIKFNPSKWLLPMGISFYIFMAVSYLIDIYKGKYLAERNFIKFAVYISFFPHILMGPIDRADKFIPQLDKEHKFSYDRTRTALQLMAFGFFKKIAVADILAMFINQVHSDLTSYTGLMLIFTAVMYSFQLYADFSGYCDIARGSAMILGFDIAENFRVPYLATSIKDFWRRWHITLSGWFTEYIYFPLGGSRVNKSRHLANLFIVFLISGIWHGNTVNFIIWGALHGIYQIIEQLLTKYRGKSIESHSTVSRIFKTCLTFTLVTFGWIFFRCKDVPSSIYYVTHMFSDFSISTFKQGLYESVKSGFDATAILIYAYIAYIIVVTVIMMIMDFIRNFSLKGQCLTNIFINMKPWKRWLCYYALVALIMAGFIMNNGGYGASANFIYNNF